LSDRFDRWDWAVALLGAAGAAAHQLVLWRWYIEDAAISFAFARNLADGAGAVAWVGGERVEGFSNPTWTALLAVCQAGGAGPFLASKVLSALLAAATAPLVYRLARDHGGRLAAALAAVAFAASAEAAIWGASGLEVALWSFALAATLSASGTEPSATAGAGWAFLAMTRPEGLAFALPAALDARRGHPIRWGLALVAPLVAVLAFRWWWFAWPLPNTYYAKLAHEQLDWADASGRGWTYVFDWARDLGRWWVAPAALAAFTGVERRGLTALITAVATTGAAALAWHLSPPAPGIEPAAGLLVAVVATILVLAPATPGTPPLLRTCGWLVAVGLGFAVYAGGDWMDGYRWMSHVAVPLSVLLGVGGARASERLGALARAPALGVAAAATLAVGLVAAGVPYTVAFRDDPETTPFDVRARIDHHHRLEERLHVDRSVVLDVDMGATMWWSGHEIVDLAGLLDVPIAHQGWRREFVREYVLDERRPDLAHVHGAWATRSHLTTLPEWFDAYVVVDDYVEPGGSRHRGNHVRKALIVPPDPPIGPAATFGDRVRLVGIGLPAPTAAPGGHLYVELAWSVVAPGPFRATVFLGEASGVQSWDVAPGYDWYTPDVWRPDEVVVTRVALPVPMDAAPGPRTLGVVVHDGQGVLPGAVETTDLAARVPTEAEALMARGELWLAVVDVRPAEDVAALAIQDLAALDDLAHVGDCGAAEAAWERARARRSGERAWVLASRAGAGRSIAWCHVEEADRSLLRADRVGHLTRALWWDPDPVGYRAVAGPLVEELLVEGHDARTLGDWELAYDAFSLAVRLDPTRSWARRWAEEARAHRLGRVAP
jgi:hypothetical protein